MERTALWLTIAALIIAIFILATHQATLEEELSHPRVETTSISTTTTTSVDPWAADLLALQQQVNELQANRGLTGPEVRELVETLLPAPQNPPTDDSCAEPPCTTATSTTARSGSTLPSATAASTSTTTGKAKRRRPR